MLRQYNIYVLLKLRILSLNYCDICNFIKHSITNEVWVETF